MTWKGGLMNLQESNALPDRLLPILLQNIPQPIIVLDQTNSIVYSNHAARSHSIEHALPRLINPTTKRMVEIGDCVYHYHKLDHECWRIYYFTDVTEIERQRDASRELETIFRSSFDELFVTDGDGVVLRINPAGERMYGLTAEQMIGKKAEELSREGYFSPSLTPEILKAKQRRSTVQTTNGGRTIYVTGNPVFDKNGEVDRIVYNIRDMTDFTKLERRLEDAETLLSNYRTELLELTGTVSDEEMSVQSEAMRRVVSVFSKVAPVDSTVLITGESGVGKSKIAILIHEWSARKSKPFVLVNCGTIPETLFESELFGYEPGAFTGARKEGKKGMIEIAEGGTLFLDEIGELPLYVQVKLLQVIQEHQFRRVGGEKIMKSDIRIIAATNRDLRNMVEAGKFREDLFFRLNVIPIQVPPLRHRTEEIPYLLDLFLQKFNQKYGLEKKMDNEVRELLMRYRWPGNIRELENLLERLVLTSEQTIIQLGDLPEVFHAGARQQAAINVHGLIPLKNAVEAVELELLRRAYQQYGSTYKMAEVLQVNQSTVVRKMNRYQIQSKEGGVPR